MTFAESFLPEFEGEMTGTRSILALVPDSLMNWKAHESLHTIGWVSSHLVDIMSWAEVTMKETSFDVAPLGGPPHQFEIYESAEPLLPEFDKNLEVAKEMIGQGSDDDFLVAWSLKQGGEVLFTMPRQAIVKMFFLNHVIHHRAILVTYLRINGIECPGLYG